MTKFVPGPPVDVLSGSADQHVVVGAAGQDVVAGAADQHVVARTAVGEEPDRARSQAKRLDHVVAVKCIELTTSVQSSSVGVAACAWPIHLASLAGNEPSRTTSGMLT